MNVALHTLPAPLQERILSETSAQCVCRAATLCRALNVAASADAVWRALFLRVWPTASLHVSASPFADWRTRFRDRWLRTCAVCEAGDADAQLRLCGRCLEIQSAVEREYDV